MPCLDSASRCNAEAHIPSRPIGELTSRRTRCEERPKGPRGEGAGAKCNFPEEAEGVYGECVSSNTSTGCLCALGVR